MFNSILLIGEILGIPIEILAQCNHFNGKHLNNPACNTTHYHPILLLKYIYIHTHISR
jgi:hypothetical protein